MVILSPHYCLYQSLTLRHPVHRRPLPILHLPFLLVLFPYPLQYPEIVQKVENGRDERAGGRDGQGDSGRDGEPAVMLRVDIDESGDEAGEGVEESDSVRF